MFLELDGEDAERYILDLLNAPKFRPNELKADCPDDFFPFSDDAIRVLVKELGVHTVPRYINEACTLVIERALIGGVLDQPDARIGSDFVHTMSQQLKELLEYK